MQSGRFAALCAAFVSIAPAVASAYTVKTSSSGAPVHWAAASIAFVPAFTPAPSSVSVAAAQGAATGAATTWSEALVGANIDVVEATTTAVAAGHRNDGVNTVRWALDASDPDIERGVLALTFVSYRTSDGAIEDADIVLNAANFTWTTNPTGCTTQYDLQSALTHELGHALGLAHSMGHPEATMYATGDACETVKRDLAPDDEAGLNSLYPKPAEPAPAVAGCSATRAGAGSGGLAVALAIALAAVRKRRTAAAVIAVAALGAAGPADASQLRRIELAELGRDAALVVRGHVVAVRPVAGDAIESDSEIAVDQCLAGSCPDTVHVVRRGGERDGAGLWVDGEAAPALGADVVVYLRRDAHGQLRVMAGVQGLLQVVATTSGTFAVRDLRGHRVMIEGAWQAGGIEAIDLPTLARSIVRPVIRRD
jgi:hypothetical protein